MLTRTLLALALLAAPVTAAQADDPFDGSEHAGVLCTAAVSHQAGLWVGTLTGGPYAVADLVASDLGVAHVDDKPGPATQVTMECDVWGGSTLVAQVRSGPSTGVVYREPVPLAFDSVQTSFRVCSHFWWVDTHGDYGSYSPDCTAATIA